MASKQSPKVITIPNDDDEDDEEDWPESGPVNLNKAPKYTDQVNEIFDNMAEMLHSDDKEALPKCIQNFQKLIVKHWHSMANADADVIIRLIYDPTCIYLHQHVSKGGVDVVIPKEEPPARKDFIWKLLEKRHKQEEIKLIIGIFDHACKAHSHLATAAANFSSLAKVMDQETLVTVMKAAVQLMVQMNIPEGFLNPVADKKPQTSEEELTEKVERTVLLRHNLACWRHEP